MSVQESVESLLRESGEHFSDHLELLADMGLDFASSLDIEQTLLKGLKRITEHVNAAGGALFLLEDEGGTLRCHACCGTTEITGLALKSDDGIVGRCVQNDMGEIVRDVRDDPNFFKGADEETGFTTKSILCAPLSVKGEKIGAIELVNKADGDGLFEHSDLRLLQGLSASAALAILNARMAEALVEQERVKRELELAAEIQRSLLPEAQGETFPVHGVNHPARTVSGDFFDFFLLDDGRVCFNLGDVSGKGMNAALLMAKTASLYRCLGKGTPEPGRLLARINEEICETATRGMFVTMVGGLYDPARGVVRLANAGHEPPLYHAGDGAFTDFPAAAPPLGISPLLATAADFPEIEIDLNGGTLYIFTDGMTEGYLEDGSMLKVEGLKKLLLENAAMPVMERLQTIIAPLYRKNVVLHDDLTVLAIDDGVAEASRATAGPAETAAGAADDSPGESLLKLHFPSKADRLKLVRAAVGKTAEMCGFSGDSIHDTVIAVDEACQNVIRHAYGGREDGEIELEIFRKSNAAATSGKESGAEEAIVILLRDYAAPVDVSKIKPRDLKDIRPGGLGTHFIREVMDEVKFLRPPNDSGNILRMVKRIP
jgi:sigma-B regulation protein RsbU (phosphoserine phosphatase)